MRLVGWMVVPLVDSAGRWHIAGNYRWHIVWHIASQHLMNPLTPTLVGCQGVHCPRSCLLSLFVCWQQTYLSRFNWWHETRSVAPRNVTGFEKQQTNGQTVMYSTPTSNTENVGLLNCPGMVSTIIVFLRCAWGRKKCKRFGIIFCLLTLICSL